MLRGKALLLPPRKRPQPDILRKGLSNAAILMSSRSKGKGDWYDVWLDDPPVYIWLGMIGDLKAYSPEQAVHYARHRWPRYVGMMDIKKRDW